MACIYAFAVLSISLIAGALILAFFGISIHALRIAGGLIVARIGFGMLSAIPEAEIDDDTRVEAMEMQDVAFTPIAMPMLSGCAAWWARTASTARSLAALHVLPSIQRPATDTSAYLRSPRRLRRWWQWVAS